LQAKTSLCLAPSPTNQPANNLPTLVWWSNLHRKKKHALVSLSDYTTLFPTHSHSTPYLLPTNYFTNWHPPPSSGFQSHPTPLDPIFAGMVGNRETRGKGAGGGESGRLVGPAVWVRRPGAALLLLRRKRKRVIKFFVPFFCGVSGESLCSLIQTSWWWMINDYI
jgi:hypothetical protein